MTTPPTNKVTDAAAAVMTALHPLSDEERARVLQSAAALYGIGLSSKPQRPNGAQDASDTGLHSDSEETRGKKLSIVEFLQAKKPATNSQRIAAFAYYREHLEGKETFARSDLEHYFALAKLPKPGNFDRDFNGAAKEGWIHEDGDASYLTQAGDAAVKEGFAGKGKPRGATVHKSK